MCTIVFDTEQSATTAKLLSNAAINDSQVEVKGAQQQRGQIPKPALLAVAGLIAAGYEVTSGVIEKARNADQEYGFTNTLQGYVEQAYTNLSTFDDSHKLGIKDTAKSAYDLVLNAYQQALNTQPGTMVKNAFDQVSEETRKKLNKQS